MSNSGVYKMNILYGNKPLGQIGSKDAVWEQIQRQAGLILEEAEELYEAAMSKDMVEVVDGTVDVWVTREYMDDLLQACNIKYKAARKEIMENNLSKVFSFSCDAKATCEAYKKKGVDTEVVEEIIEGELLFIVKRKPDGKVMKPINHQPPQLEEFIPQFWLEK